MEPKDAPASSQVVSGQGAAQFDSDESAAIASVDELLRDAALPRRDQSERARTESAPHHELERRYRDGIRLTEANRALMGVFDFDAVTAIICRAARDLLGAEGACFVLRDGGRVRYVQEDAVSPLWKGQDFPLDACISGWAIAHAQTAVIADIGVDPRIPLDAYRPTFVKALVMAPVGPGIKVASLGVYWASLHEADAYELELLHALASVADLALAGVRVYEQAVRARAEAEQASRLKDQFLATISHELRSPLNGIVGFSQLLLREGTLSDTARSYADKIHRNAQTQARLIDDLLDLSGIQARTFDITRQSVDLASLVSDVVQGVLAIADSKRITLSLDAPSVRCTLDADPARMKQVVRSLLDNALAFTPAGGTIRVRVIARESELLLEVQDNGEGIAPDFLPHVFEPFRQADAELTRRHGGLGIGLALVAQLVAAHDGKVSAASEGRGRGATFRVSLPRTVQPTLHTPSDAPKSSATLAGLRLLVVDDCEDSVELLALLLERHGADVVRASGGAAALQYVDSRDFDMIVSDISMPDMDGYELIRRIRTRAKLAKTPALALTGFGRPEDVRLAQEAGFTGHLTKPIDIAKLVALIEKSQQTSN